MSDARNGNQFFSRVNVPETDNLLNSTMATGILKSTNSAVGTSYHTFDGTSATSATISAEPTVTFVTNTTDTTTATVLTLSNGEYEGQIKYVLPTNTNTNITYATTNIFSSGDYLDDECIPQMFVWSMKLNMWISLSCY